MEKDIEQLKEAILGIEVTQFDGQKTDLEELLNPRQLEEIIDGWMPEILSQEWIEDNQLMKIAPEGVVYYVAVDDLQNLIVPKQELPVIPKYVAKYLEFAKSDFSLKRVLELASTMKELAGWEDKYDWISANNETFARAWLLGYEVEEEPLYRVSAGSVVTGFWFLCKDDNGNIVIGTNKDYYEADWDSLKLTEQEIKDYDSRYMEFAELVKVVER